MAALGGTTLIVLICFGVISFILFVVAVIVVCLRKRSGEYGNYDFAGFDVEDAENRKHLPSTETDRQYRFVRDGSFGKWLKQSGSFIAIKVDRTGTSSDRMSSLSTSSLGLRSSLSWMRWSKAFSAKGDAEEEENDDHVNQDNGNQNNLQAASKTTDQSTDENGMNQPSLSLYKTEDKRRSTRNSSRCELVIEEEEGFETEASTNVDEEADCAKHDAPTGCDTEDPIESQGTK